MHGGRCPRCGKPLRKPTPRDISIHVDVRKKVEQLLVVARRMHAPLTGAEMHLANLLGINTQSGEEAIEAA